MVRSPYNDKLIYRLPFNPNVIDCLGLCTKDPGKMIPHLDALKNWKTLWHVTITKLRDMSRQFQQNYPK